MGKRLSYRCPIPRIRQWYRTLKASPTIKHKTKPCYNPGMSTQDLDDKAKELRQGKNILCRTGITNALREVKYRCDHEMYGKAKESVEDLELLVRRIPACNPTPKLKRGPSRQRSSK